jgi:murein L,D-transpeptidase YcbB/YkuD
VLAGQPTSRPDALTRAMAPGAPSVVTVARSLPVYLLYWTAFVDDEGRLQLVDWPSRRGPDRLFTGTTGKPVG